MISPTNHGAVGSEHVGPGDREGRPTVSEAAGIQVRPACASDWPWMLDRYAETAWESMSPRRQENTSLAEVRAQLQAQVARFRGPEGSPNAALVACTASDDPLGFVWVLESTSGFSGRPFAWVMCLYVQPTARRRGLGRTLLGAAEAWARECGLEEMVLNVSARNRAALALYADAGFEQDTLRLSKALARPDGG